MTNEYEWIDSRDESKREFGSADVLLGWVIYAVAVLYMAL